MYWCFDFSHCQTPLSGLHRKGSNHDDQEHWALIIPSFYYQLSYDFFSQVFDSGTGYITVLPLIWPEGRSVDELREVNRKFKTNIWQLICTAPCSGDQKLDDWSTQGLIITYYVDHSVDVVYWTLYDCQPLSKCCSSKHHQLCQLAVNLPPVLHSVQDLNKDSLLKLDLSFLFEMLAMLINLLVIVMIV